MKTAVSLQQATQHWALLVALALFLTLALPDLGLPGLHYDEALEAAMPATLLLQGQQFPIVNNGVLQFGTLSLPLMVQNHIGALQVYAAMPFVMLMGPTTVALRTMTVVVGASTLIGVYAFMLRAYGGVAAGAAVLWLAAFPSFILWSRQGAFVTNLAPCLAVWALAVASASSQFRIQSSALPRPLTSPFFAPRSSFVVGLLAGLAVWAKLSALWLVIGTIVWAAIAWLAQYQNRRTSSIVLRLSSFIPSMLGFLFGISPIIIYNLITGFKTFSAVGESASTTYLGTSNLDVVSNFQTRLLQFVDVIVSGQHLWYLGGAFSNPLALVSLIVALVAIVLSQVARRGHGWQRDLFLPFLALACIAQSCFTISALWYTHFAIVIWLPATIVGVAAGVMEHWGVGVIEYWSSGSIREGRIDRLRQSIVSAAVMIFLLVVVTPQAGSTLAYLRSVEKTGGLSFHSSAIEDVSRFLAARPEPIVALDWGLSAQVEYLTDGRKRVEEFYGFSHDVPPDFATMLRERFGRNELYLTHAPNEEAFPRRQAFLDAVAAAGLRAETVNVSVRKDGLPVIEVWKVTRST